MGYLPNITHIIQKPTFIENDFFTLKTLRKLNMVIKDIVSGSCMAMLINSDIIWNEFDESVTFNERFQQNSIREHITNNPDSLLYEIIKKNKDARVYFYLYKTNTLLITLFIEKTDDDYEFHLKFMQ